MSEHILEHQNCAIHYWLHGDDPETPVLVLTHGAGCDHRLFDPQLAALAPHCRVLTWDVRRHGQSKQRDATPFSIGLVADDLAVVLDAARISTAIVGGQSMGGQVAQLFAERYPARTRALVLIDTANNHAALTRLERFGVALTPTMLKLYPFETLLVQSGKAAAITADAQHYVTDAMRLLRKDDILQVMTGTLNVLRDDPDFRFNLPMLMVRGDHSNAGSIKKQMPAWALREPHAIYRVIPDAGHCCNLDNPAAFNAELIAFVRQLAPAKA
jgi:3-oxoadipate enol-lactonase